MSTTTPAQDRTSARPVDGGIPAQRPAPASPARVAPARMAPPPRRRPGVLGGLAAGLALGTIGAAGMVLALSAAVATPPGPAPAAPAVPPGNTSPGVSVPGRVSTTVREGVWQVGVDIAPGTYATAGRVTGSACHHARRTARTGGGSRAARPRPGPPPSC